LLQNLFLDLAGISGYNNFKVIYLLGMALPFPANTKRGGTAWSLLYR